MKYYEDIHVETLKALGDMGLRTMNFQYHYQNISKIVEGILKKHEIILKDAVVNELITSLTEYKL